MAEFFDTSLPYKEIRHFQMICQLLDAILQLLGPDFEVMAEILERLGARHKRMGVSPDAMIKRRFMQDHGSYLKPSFSIGFQVPPQFFPHMVTSVIHALKQTLGESFTEEHEQAWEEVYGAITDDIVFAIKN